MTADKKPRFLEILLISLPVLIAAVQIYLSSTSNLTSWRGGGFGMYTEPHPLVSRFIWMEGVGRDSLVAVRLYPLDERLQARFVRRSGIKIALEHLKSVARESREFPAIANRKKMEAEWLWFLDHYGDDPTIQSLFPVSSLRLKVVEIWLSPDFHSLESRLISDREL